MKRQDKYLIRDNANLRTMLGVGDLSYFPDWGKPRYRYISLL